jgi:hypothetical protein
MNATETNK